MILRNEAGEAIRSVEDWLRLAPPKKKDAHWHDGRSAKELAKAWFRGAIPSPPTELMRLFASHPTTYGITVCEAIAERRLRLDRFAGEPRNADLWLRCAMAGDTVVATVEAKADESFGSKMGPYYDSKFGTRSKLPERIDALCNAIFGSGLTPGIRSLRYQLLHGAAATLISAKEYGATKAIFIVHAFRSAGCSQSAVIRNSEDWHQFLRALSASSGLTETREQPAKTVIASKMFGPVVVPGGEFVPFGIPLLLGYIQTNLT